MNQSPPRPPISGWIVGAVFTALAAFYLSTDSPFVMMLAVLYAASLFLPQRFERDSGGIWGLRLLVYATLAVLGRAPTGAPGYFVDAQAFTTAGLIAGGELILQAFRRPPQGARFDGWIVSLSGVIFLIACNTNRGHIWLTAPMYMMFLLLSLVDLRPRAARQGLFSGTRRVLMLCIAVTLGAALHQTLWAYRGSIIALGARIFTERGPGSQGANLGDAPSLSSSFSSGASTARLMRIEGSLNDSHLRMAAYDDYQNGMWGPATSKRNIASALPNETREEDEHKVRRTKTDAKIIVLRDTGGILFAPLNSWALLPAEGQSFDWDRYQGPIKTEEPPPVSYYIIDSKADVDGVPTTQGPLCVAPSRLQRARLLVVPTEIDPRVKALAQEVSLEGNSPAEKAALIVDYLFKTNKYSLNFVRGAQDPVSDFVLNKKAAHCQYFASAAVMMLRSVGIPARYVTGYYAHEAGDDGATIVRGRDAHAWTEAFIDGVGWVVLDATPPAGRADPAVSPLPWYQKWLEWTQDTFTRVRAWFATRTQLQIFEMVLFIVALWGLERWRQARKVARRRQAGQVPPPELAPLARRFERVLARRGISLSAGRPWSEAVPDDLEGEREWIEGYNRARFDESDEAELRELERELEKLEKGRKEKTEA